METKIVHEHPQWSPWGDVSQWTAQSPQATSEHSTSSPWQISLLSVQKTKVEPAHPHGETPLSLIQKMQSKRENV